VMPLLLEVTEQIVAFGGAMNDDKDRSEREKDMLRPSWNGADALICRLHLTAAGDVGSVKFCVTEACCGLVEKENTWST